MTLVHISRPRGYYLGQVCARGCRDWWTVTGHCRSAESALAKAVMSMRGERSRARSLFVDTSGYYEPHVAMEARR